MKITLLRHGKPVLPSLDRIYAKEFNAWIQDYNSSHLAQPPLASEAALNHANTCNALVCSDLARSIDSAKALNKEKIILSDAIFNEAGLPAANWKILKLSPKIWAVLFRILWLFGYSKNSESFREAKKRAADAVRILIKLAYKHEHILFIGHGVYNRILANELRKTGWSGPKNPGASYWSFAVYKQ